MILALDLGTTTGYAFALAGGAKASGRVPLRGQRYENAEMRYLNLAKFLDRMHALEPVREIWFEIVRRHSATKAAHAYGGYLATLQSWCETNNVALAGVEVGAIKKFATGKGNASKRLVMEAVEDRFGVPPIDDNEADAIAIREMVLADAVA